MYDANSSRAEPSRVGDAARDALDEFRGLMDDRDERGDAEVRVIEDEGDSSGEEDSEKWDVDTTFAKLLAQE